jgi:hypothetical protein
MDIPVHVRKWLIRRYTKQKEIEFKKSNPEQTDTTQPLNSAQKARFKKQEKKNKA